MYLDIKNTVWERVEFDSEEQMNDVIAKLKSGELKNGCDVCEYLDKSTEWIDETAEEMIPEDNDNQSTMEIHDGNTELEDIIWENV